MFGDDTVVVRGAVTDVNSGQPLGGVLVHLEAGGAFGSTPDRLDSDRTASDGTFELETTTDECTGLFRGFYVGVYSDDYGYTSAGAECESGSQVIDIEMTPRSL